MCPSEERGTTAAETLDNVKWLKAITKDTPAEVKDVRHDRGPENVSTMKKMRDEGEIEPVPGVSHGATGENAVGRISTGTQRARMTAGWPTLLWLLLPAAYCFNLTVILVLQWATQPSA